MGQVCQLSGLGKPLSGPSKSERRRGALQIMMIWNVIIRGKSSFESLLICNYANLSSMLSQIYIPFELPDISALRRFVPRPLISQTKAWVVRQLPDEDTSLIDIAYEYKLPSDIREWVPPFKSKCHPINRFVKVSNSSKKTHLHNFLVPSI